MPHSRISYWWLNANPSIWEFEAKPVGDTETYSTHNEAGNKRRIYQWFHKVKRGDLVIGYVTSPQQQVVAICEIAKPVHRTGDGDSIEFKKIEQLENPIPLKTLLQVPELKCSEPIVKRRGSLFRLTKRQYKLVRALEKPGRQLIRDVESVKASRRIARTTKQALIDARIGQGTYGAEVRRIWRNRCAVTGLATKVLLEASHIKSWANSTNSERLDPRNGLLLTANLHRLFDAGLISFRNSGRMMVSRLLSRQERRLLKLAANRLSQKPPRGMGKYLAYHRKLTFQ
jgi:hypothetical protein